MTITTTHPCTCAPCEHCRNVALRKAAIKAMSSNAIHIGKPCRICGGKVRYKSNGNCVPCSKAAAARHTRARRELAKLFGDIPNDAQGSN